VRRTICIGFLVATSLIAAPIARASDDSLRQVVKSQAARQTKQDAKFKAATKSITSREKAKKARTATILQQKSVETFRTAVRAEQADTDQVKAGRSQLLDGLAMYNHGLDKLRTALTQAIKTNGRGGGASAKAALKTLAKALDEVASAAKKINPTA
jgi:soluble cytochrome b562